MCPQQLQEQLEKACLPVEECSVQFIESGQSQLTPFAKAFNEDHCYFKEIEEPVFDIQMTGVNLSNKPEKSGKTVCSKPVIIKECTLHQDMFELKDDALLKPGDKMATIQDFVKYVNTHAKRWMYYYRSVTSHPTRYVYDYGCVLHKCTAPSARFKTKGLRRRIKKEPSNCPCKIILRRIDDDEDFTVVYVCNHHDHELTADKFYRLPHVNRLPSEIKEEMFDLAALELDTGIFRKYISAISGFKLKSTDIYNIVTKMKKYKIQRQFSPEKIKILSKKIKELKELYGKTPRIKLDDNPVQEKKIGQKRQAKSNSAYETLDVLAELSRNKKQIQKTMTHDADITENELGSEHKKSRKKSKKRSKATSDETSTKSRLEICLENLSYDQELLQSVSQLQQSVRCETQINPSSTDFYNPNGNSITMHRSEESEDVTTANTAYVFDTQSIPDQESNIFSENYFVHDNNDGEILTNEANHSVISDGYKNLPDESYSENDFIKYGEIQENIILNRNKHFE